MTSVIVDYAFKNVFLTFYIRQAGSLKRREACDNLSPRSPPLFSAFNHNFWPLGASLPFVTQISGYAYERVSNNKQ